MSSIVKKYLKSDPRASVDIYAECHADDVVFTKDFEDMPLDLRRAFNSGKLKIPCEGGGVPGEWCDDCPFGIVERS